jgi:hypothetical protein
MESDPRSSIDVAATFVAMLSDDFSLPPSITSSLAFALTLCSSEEGTSNLLPTSIPR